MNRSSTILVLAFAGGAVVAATFGPINSIWAFFGWYFALCAAWHLIVGCLLYTGVVAPSRLVGRSALGQAFYGLASIALATMTFGVNTLPDALGWSVSIVGAAVFVAGALVEAKKRTASLQAHAAR